MAHAVRVNLANPAELLELPGVGPQQVNAILEYRTTHGPITSKSELAQILRLGSDSRDERPIDAPKQKHPPGGADGSLLSVVAGTRSHLYRTHLLALSRR